MQPEGGMEARFHDRRDAGRWLGRSLSAYAGRDDLVVLGLPRGGVAIAYEIARALRAPLDVLVVRRLGFPGYDELAMGAIASGGIQVVNPRVTSELGVSPAVLRGVAERAAAEVARRERALRGEHDALDVAGKTAIVIDDGLATGSSMLAAVTSLRLRAAASVVVAVPVAARAIADVLRAHVDDLRCLVSPADVESVDGWYDGSAQVTDDEVRALLERARRTDRGEHADTSPGPDQYRHAPRRRTA